MDETMDGWVDGINDEILIPMINIFVITSCAVYKIPQIATLVRIRSFEGVNLYSLILEMFSYTTTTLYNFYYDYSLLTYLEYPVILIQQGALIALVYSLAQLKEKRIMQQLFILYIILYGSIISGLIHFSLLNYLLQLGTPISCISKIISILDMLNLQDARAVSLTTWFLSFVTNALRIVTVQHESGDQLLLTNFALSTVLSATALGTACYFQYTSRMKLSKAD